METKIGTVKIFESQDLCLASCLKLLDIPYLGIRVKNRIGLFQFRNSEEVQTLTGQFLEEELLVEPLKFYRIWKELRSQLAEALSKEAKG